jgi:hypothetical protein
MTAFQGETLTGTCGKDTSQERAHHTTNSIQFEDVHPIANMQPLLDYLPTDLCSLALVGLSSVLLIFWHGIEDSASRVVYGAVIGDDSNFGLSGITFR